mmetsp:Transcript_23100/g.54527  ORF Transcript_23100/g.54527 Transcript_23100/m.54527 type:complete len:278 (-) Transcript_23100:264-1097(-)
MEGWNTAWNISAFIDRPPTYAFTRWSTLDHFASSGGSTLRLARWMKAQLVRSIRPLIIKARTRREQANSASRRFSSESPLKNMSSSSSPRSASSSCKDSVGASGEDHRPQQLRVVRAEAWLLAAKERELLPGFSPCLANMSPYSSVARLTNLSSAKSSTMWLSSTRLFGCICILYVMETPTARKASSFTLSDKGSSTSEVWRCALMSWLVTSTVADGPIEQIITSLMAYLTVMKLKRTLMRTSITKGAMSAALTNVRGATFLTRSLMKNFVIPRLPM